MKTTQWRRAVENRCVFSALPAWRRSDSDSEQASYVGAVLIDWWILLLLLYLHL